jgi:hypothetical protein
MALGFTQPLVKMSTRNIPGGKGGQYVRLTSSPPLCAECHEIWESKPPETLWATPGLLRDFFPFFYGGVFISCLSMFTHVVSNRRILLTAYWYVVDVVYIIL